jgi:opacity protein-like surface antigen
MSALVNRILIAHCRNWRALPLAGALVLIGGAATPARADVVFGGSMGYYALQAEDGRSVDDVLFQNRGFLIFDLEDFNGFTFGGEFLVGLGNFVEAGVGAGYYQKTVPSVYADFVDSDGTEIDQDLKLRVMPVTFTARLFPVGRDAPIQPYVGGGVAILSWRYTETGEFVDFNNGNQIFRDIFEDEGKEAAPVAFAGVRFPVGDNMLLGGEFRWHGGEASLDPSQGFAGDRLDLGAYTAQAIFQVRFGR